MASKALLALLGALLVGELAFAEARQLLTEVTDKELLAEIRVKNDYFLKQHLYSSRRHKIVTADIDALLSSEPIAIPLFAGKSIVLEPASVEERPAAILWSGVVDSPPKSLDELTSITGSAECAKLSFEARYGVAIAASRRQHNLEFDVNFPYYTPNEQPVRTDLYQSNENDGPIFYGVTANFRLANLSSTYILRPLEMGGAYHVFYEVDPSKVVPPGPVDNAEHPEIAAKQDALRRFRQSLGEDPRKEILRIKRQRQELREGDHND